MNKISKFFFVAVLVLAMAPTIFAYDIQFPKKTKLTEVQRDNITINFLMCIKPLDKTSYGSLSSGNNLFKSFCKNSENSCNFFMSSSEVYIEKK